MRSKHACIKPPLNPSAPHTSATTRIGDLICAAAVMVISSLFEGKAGAAIEAMALVTPIVSTDVAGLRGILEHERNALLVQCGGAAALASGIDRVLTDQNLADGLATTGATEFVSRYAVDAGAKRLHALYRDTINRAPEVWRTRESDRPHRSINGAVRQLDVQSRSDCNSAGHSHRGNESPDERYAQTAAPQPVTATFVNV